MRSIVDISLAEAVYSPQWLDGCTGRLSCSSGASAGAIDCHAGMLALASIPASTHLDVREVHFGMLGHELLEHILLLLFVTRRLALSLHLLIIHHFLNHAPSVTVQIGEFGVFGRDLCRVNLGSGRDNMRPPM